MSFQTLDVETPSIEPTDMQVSGKKATARQVSQCATQKSAENRVLITTVPFGELDCRPLDLLEANGFDYVINPIGRKLKEHELADLIGDFDVLIAGTEPISAKVMDRAPHLRLIARVGIGLDNVDLLEARKRGILVTYTPDAPSAAVAELAIGLMISLLRFIPQSDRGLRNGIWRRYMGRRLAESTVGIIGVGRIGKRVIRLMRAFGCRVLANDLKPDFEFGAEYGVTWMEKEEIFKECDIISLHIPLTPITKRLIKSRQIDMMKSETVLINTSRGNMIDEGDLIEALRAKRIAGAALDVFDQEPYTGDLTKIENCILTCHNGSMSRDCRTRMELEATEEAIRFLTNQPLKQLVPESEYKKVL